MDDNIESVNQYKDSVVKISSILKLFSKEWSDKFNLSSNVVFFTFLILQLSVQVMIFSKIHAATLAGDCCSENPIVNGLVACSIK